MFIDPNNTGPLVQFDGIDETFNEAGRWRIMFFEDRSKL